MSDFDIDLKGKRRPRTRDELTRVFEEENPTPHTLNKFYELAKNSKLKSWEIDLQKADLAIRSLNFLQYGVSILLLEYEITYKRLGADTERAKLEVKKLKDKYKTTRSASKVACQIMLTSVDKNNEHSSLPLKMGILGAAAGSILGLFGGPFAEVSAPVGAFGGFGIGSSLGSMFSRGENTRKNSRRVVECESVGANPWSAGEVLYESGSIILEMIGLGSNAVTATKLARALSPATSGHALGVVGYSNGMGGVVRGEVNAAVIRGTENGPDALRRAGLVDNLPGEVLDVGNAEPSFIARNWPIRFSQAEKLGNNHRAVYLANVALADKVEEVARAGYTPLVLGGDHAGGLGAVAGAARAAGKPVGLIWFDAHTDINTLNSSLTGNIHGMPVSMLLGIEKAAPNFSKIQKMFQAVRPENLVYIGVREIDDAEKLFLAKYNIKYFKVDSIKDGKLKDVIDQAVAIASKDTPGFVFSFDLDGMSKMLAKATGTPVEDGFNFKETKQIVAQVAKSGLTLSYHIFEYNPLKDSAGKITAQAAIKIAKIFETNRALTTPLVKPQVPSGKGLKIVNALTSANAAFRESENSENRK